MNLITKLSLIAATMTAVGTGAAFADDHQLQNRLALQRAQEQASPRTTTIAVYADRHAVSQRSMMQSKRSEARFQMHSDAHVHTFGGQGPGPVTYP